MAESEEELKSLLMKEESGKSWHKAQHSENEDHGIWSHHLMANRGKTVGAVAEFIFLWAPKSLQMVTAAMKLKAAYFLEEKLWPTRQHIKTQRHCFANKGPSKLWFFPVVMYGCESWTVKKAECWKIAAFELWCWRRILRVPWTTRRSNQSILKKISPEYSLERLMLKLKLQYSGHLMRRTDSLEKTQMLGMIEGRRRRGQQRMRWLDGITDLMGNEFK